MHEVYFTIHSENPLLPDKVGSLLSDLIMVDQDFQQDLDESEIRDWVERKQLHFMPNGKFSSAWVLRYDFGDDAAIPASALLKTTSEFLKSVSDLPGVIQVLKYRDTVMHERARQYFEEVFEIEMELRRVLNYILLYNGRDDLEKTFKDFNAATVESYDKNRAKEYFENELYYVLFSVYGQFQQPRILRDTEVVQLLTSVDDISTFFQNLRNRPLETERHRDFLSSIKQFLKPIEDLRNAVAHHRALSKTYESNYEKSHVQLQEAIAEFWKSEQQHTRYRLPDGKFIWEEVVTNEVRGLMQGVSKDEETGQIIVPMLSFDPFLKYERLWDLLTDRLSNDYEKFAPPADHENRKDYNAFESGQFVDELLASEFEEWTADLV